ncbi:MAG: CpsD/CapB family tyrosine-protein kinase [Roseivivax sp.]|nr:CpsD/CapB family tyrosine-protein kinase [Roseivivax sp.]
MSELDAKRRRIEELRREKARLADARKRREERARADEAARQAAEARREAEQRADASRLAEVRSAERARIEHELAEQARHEAALIAEERKAAEEALRLDRAPARSANDTLILSADDQVEPDFAAEEDWDEDFRDTAVTPGRADTAPAAPAVRRAAETDDLDDAVDGPWAELRSFAVDEAHLERNRLITAARNDLAHTAFDVLRTRLLQALRQNGWSRVAITSPSKDCGKTFSAANLAMSLARQENCRTVLLDFDMRRPSLAKVFGVKKPGPLGAMLRGEVAPEEHLRCMGANNIAVGRNLAFGFNDAVEPFASELLQDSTAARVLKDIEERFEADVLLFDMPPALYHDDVLAARNLFDGVLLIVGGGITKASEVKDVERRLGADTPLLGTVLNFSEGPGITRYSY